MYVLEVMREVQVKNNGNQDQGERFHKKTRKHENGFDKGL